MNTLQDIQQRIACNDLSTRLEALREALNHDQAGLKLIRANLNDKQRDEEINRLKKGELVGEYLVDIRADKQASKQKLVA